MRKLLKILCVIALVCAFGMACGTEPGQTRGPEQEDPQEQEPEDYYYYYQKEKQYFSLDTKHAYLALNEPQIPEDITRRGIAYDEIRDVINPYNPDAKDFLYYTKLIFMDGLSDKEYIELLADIKQETPEIIIQPYLWTESYGRKVEVGLTHFFLVKLKQESDVSLLEREAAKINVVIDHQNDFMPLWYMLALSKDTKYNTMKCAAIFYESGLFQEATPEVLEATNLP